MDVQHVPPQGNNLYKHHLSLKHFTTIDHYRQHQDHQAHMVTTPFSTPEHYVGIWVEQIVPHRLDMGMVLGK